MPLIKLILLAIILILTNISMDVHAQNINWSAANASEKKDSIDKRIYDNAKYIVTYDYKFANDSKKPKKKRWGITQLLIGEKNIGFRDYFEAKFDSIYDGIAKGESDLYAATPKLMDMLKKVRYEESIITDLSQKKNSIQFKAGSTTRYQYDEKTPEMNWKLAEGDTVIAGYRCNRADLSYAGRNYIAWYTPELDLPYGPYKFNGLPGLILMIKDSNEEHIFFVRQIRKTEKYTPIYNRKLRIHKTSRDNARKIIRNYHADPAAALTADGSVILPESSKSGIKSRPYNPIELE